MDGKKILGIGILTIAFIGLLTFLVSARKEGLGAVIESAEFGGF